MPYQWIIDALAETWGEISTILKECRDSDLDVPTALPGWSVRDVVSHLIGFELMLTGVAAPVVDGGHAAHVKNFVGELNEPFVIARRDRSRTEMLNEFATVTSSSLDRLAALDDAAWDVVGWSPEGDAPYHRFMETRLLDSWIHLGDIRDALGMPDDDSGVGADVVITRFAAALTYIVGKRVAPGEGKSVRVNITGRLARTVTVVVRDGRAVLTESIHEEPSATLTMSAGAFWRLAAGRIDADVARQKWGVTSFGDPEISERLLHSMAVMI